MNTQAEYDALRDVAALGWRLWDPDCRLAYARVWGIRAIRYAESGDTERLAKALESIDRFRGEGPWMMNAITTGDVVKFRFGERSEGYNYGLNKGESYKVVNVVAPREFPNATEQFKQAMARSPWGGPLLQLEGHSVDYPAKWFKLA